MAETLIRGGDADDYEQMGVEAVMAWAHQQAEASGKTYRLRGGGVRVAGIAALGGMGYRVETDRGVPVPIGAPPLIDKAAFTQPPYSAR